MKIAVVGCGAVGSFYGACLARAGHEVHFLLRSDYEVVRRKGVFVHSPRGDFHVQPTCARRPEEIGPSQVVLVALKTTANEQFRRLLPPLVGQGTALVTLQNGLGNEERLARLFPAEQILGGLCFVCLNRTEPGVVRHIDHGRIVLGEFQRWPEPRTHELAGTFRQAGVSCVVTDNLARAHWEKLVWNIPFNGLGVAATMGFDALAGEELEIRGEKFPRPLVDPAATTLPTDQLLSDRRWAKLVRDLMLEVITGARALGFDLADSLAESNIEHTRTMGAYKASTLIDFERGLPLELESLFLEPCRQAKEKGVSVPRLERLCQVLRALDPARSVQI